MGNSRDTGYLRELVTYDESNNVTFPANVSLVAPAGGDNSTKVPSTAWVRTYVSGVASLSTSGTSGANGSSGSSGQTGAAGSSGSSGSSGQTGAAGSSGSSGSSGQTGAAGSSGSSGSSGNTGAAGSSGSSGQTGAAGSSGSSGQSGAAGSSGSSGQTGAAGSSGSSGSSGTRGSSGSSGSSGQSGAAGSSGSSGQTGGAGSSGTSGAGTISGGSVNSIAKFSGATTLTTSTITDNGTNVTVSGGLTIGTSTADSNFPFYVTAPTTTNRYSLASPGMGFNLADNYAQLQLFGTAGGYIDFQVSANQDYSGRIIYTTASGFNISSATTITGNISASNLSGTNTGDQTNISGNAVTVSNLTAVQFFNNMGNTHGTRTGFDASSPSYDFGFRYVQGSTNGPGTGGQFYSWYIGLGNDYPATGGGSYGMYVAINRTSTGGGNPYLSVRYNENNTLGSWSKISAGYADTAGSATDSTKLPLAGGTMSGPIRRSSHASTFFEGSYNNVGGNSAYTNPIYTIGSSYNPTDSSLSNMYGIGYAHPNLWGAGKTSDWGLYVCNAGTINATLGSGAVTIWASNDIVAYSDIRVKDNIEVVTKAIEKIKAIRGVTFTRKDAALEDKGKRHAGVIAQEVLKVLPEVVTGTEEDMYSVAYGNMAALFIEAIKEQQTQIEDQGSEIRRLKSLIGSLLGKNYK